MKDVNIQTPDGLSAAEDAVLYLLKRLRHDADIRWLMIGTESYHRLCVAEAQRTGQDAEAVKDHYARPHPYCKDELPRIKQLQAKIDKLESASGDAGADWISIDEDAPMREAVESALDMCPVCAGLAIASINRCAMCRKLAGVI